MMFTRSALRPSRPPSAASAVSVLLLLFSLVLPVSAHAHVGNKDIFQILNAGPYQLFITIRPPNVIPGVATVEVRTDSPVNALRITPVPLVGEGAKHAPTPDAMQVEPGAPGSFSGSLWLMTTGSWQVRFDVDGAQGTYHGAVPVPAVALRVMTMQRPLGMLLGVLGIVLIVGFAGIIAAATREACLAPGNRPAQAQRRRSRIAGGLTFAVLVVTCALGNKWWNVDAANYAGSLYHPLAMTPTLDGSVLTLALGSKQTNNDPVHVSSPPDLLEDHGKLMHLYAIRSPQMDAVFHLHPKLTSDWKFTDALPAMPPGEYRLFADIVHRNGFPETLTTTINVPPGMSTRPLAYDDAEAEPPPISGGELPPKMTFSDGYAMVWDRPAKLTAGQGLTFRFTLLGPDGKPATDMVPYLGMAGHAAFVKDDFTAFAHTHPEGSSAMAAVMIANGASPGSLLAPGEQGATSSVMQMPASDAPLLPTVGFPYGFPSAGRYRLFIQMKHGGAQPRVETGVFDAAVK
jgi:hypothetical protein